MTGQIVPLPVAAGPCEVPDPRPRIVLLGPPALVEPVEATRANLAALACIEAVPIRDARTGLASILDALRADPPNLVLTDPRWAEHVSERLPDVRVAAFELASDGLVPFVEATARDVGVTVGLLVPVGILSAATMRLLRRAGPALSIFTYEGPQHLLDVIVRAKRSGVWHVIGDAEVAAAADGMLPWTALYEATGATVYVRSIALALERYAEPRQDGALAPAYRLLVEQFATGALRPTDAAIVVVGGHVVGVYGTVPDAVRVGAPVDVALGHLAQGTAMGEVPIDVLPLDGNSGGYVLIARGEMRPVPHVVGGTPPDDRLTSIEALLRDAMKRRPKVKVRRFLAAYHKRTFLIDWAKVRYFELRSGLVYAGLVTGEQYATNYTLADIAARVDPRDFFRIHRNVLVNLNYVTELERYAVSQFRVLIEGPGDASFVVSRPASAALRKLLKF